MALLLPVGHAHVEMIHSTKKAERCFISTGVLAIIQTQDFQTYMCVFIVGCYPLVTGQEVVIFTKANCQTVNLMWWFTHIVTDLDNFVIFTSCHCVYVSFGQTMLHFIDFLCVFHTFVLNIIRLRQFGPQAGKGGHTRGVGQR